MADAFIAVLVIEINSDRTSYHDQCSYHPTLFLTPHSDILKTDNAPCFGQIGMRETPFSDQEFSTTMGIFRTRSLKPSQSLARWKAGNKITLTWYFVMKYFVFLDFRARMIRD